MVSTEAFHNAEEPDDTGAEDYPSEYTAEDKHSSDFVDYSTLHWPHHMYRSVKFFPEIQNLVMDLCDLENPTYTKWLRRRAVLDFHFKSTLEYTAKQPWSTHFSLQCTLVWRLLPESYFSEEP